MNRARGKDKADPIDAVLRLRELGLLKLALLLQKTELSEEKRAQLAAVLPDHLREETVLSVEERTLYSLADSADPDGQRLFHAVRLCRGEVALTLLELCVLTALEPESASYLELAAPGSQGGVSILTAARATGFLDDVNGSLLAMADAAESAKLLLKPLKPEQDADYASQLWRADPYLLDHLAGGQMQDGSLAEFTARFDPPDPTGPVYGFDGDAVQLGGQIRSLYTDRGIDQDRQALTVIVEGDRESGRFTTVRLAAATAGIRLLSADYAWIREASDPRDIIGRIVRCCALEQRALCIRGITKDDDAMFLLQRIQRNYDKAVTLPLFMTADPGVKPAPFLTGTFLLRRIPTDQATALALWKGYFAGEGEETAESLASRMTLTAGQIRRVAQAVRTARAAGEEVDEKRICRMCYEVLDDGRYDNVKWVKPGFSFDDVKIDARNRAILKDIADQVRLRRRVYEEWGMRTRYAYGRCVSVILAGPPGTGKTMSVHALAAELGLELYKVDLSRIVDKYIGETEKRLEEVFTRAEKSNMILFFDEADAVMGKRSEVKDAQDKYANTEISYILQRIEEFDGIVMLATNNLQNIDQAFMRRIRYVLNFERPNPVTREEIWRGAFADGVPLSDDIDFDYLAKTFDLSGGEIKNVVLNAVFYGAADGGPVSMRHIMKSLQRESLKQKRGVTFDGDLGKYAYLVTPD